MAFIKFLRRNNKASIYTHRAEIMSSFSYLAYSSTSGSLQKVYTEKITPDSTQRGTKPGSTEHSQVY